MAGLLRRAALRSAQPRQPQRVPCAGPALRGLCGRLRGLRPLPWGRGRGQPQLLADQPGGPGLLGGSGTGMRVISRKRY